MASVNVWALGVYAGAVLLIVGGMLLTSYLAGQRHSERATNDPYESGIVSTGTAELRFSARFYLIAMLFVIFDLEAAILFAWAVAVPETGWPAFIAVAIFVGILLAALFYEWRQGALDLGPKPRARRAAGGRAGANGDTGALTAAGPHAAEKGAHALVAD
jgi:NADH-quinone oxidoreductase subunit A